MANSSEGNENGVLQEEETSTKAKLEVLRHYQSKAKNRCVYIDFRDEIGIKRSIFASVGKDDDLENDDMEDDTVVHFTENEGGKVHEIEIGRIYGIEGSRADWPTD